MSILAGSVLEELAKKLETCFVFRGRAEACSIM